MIDKTVRLGLLLDFYGPLLTEKQRQYFKLYHQEDMSLGEIADEYGVTRQAVYDLLQRSQKSLLDLEGKLGLAKRYARQSHELEMIKNRLEDLSERESLQKSVSDELAAIKQLVGEMLAEF
ncbi:MAG: YlxM family DNA-binding protein [Firmicutes bacterium]|nr:YlxM family DNA-binding protein [Bacillota bacterium]